MNKQVAKYSGLMREFGIRCAYNEFILRITGKVFGINSNKWKELSAKKYRYIDSLLRNEMSDLIRDFSTTSIKNKPERETIKDDCPIWIFWNSGEEHAPLIIKYCIQSIKKHAKSHPIILLDDSNFSDYVNIDERILSLYRKGIISVVHFSDILRFKLLQEYGGIWCDASIFASKEIDKNNLSRFDFFSIKHGIGENYLACRGLWTSFFIAVSTDNLFPRFITEAYKRYWSKHTILIDYLLLDCLMYIAYQSISTVKDSIDSVPYNNAGVFDLMTAFERTENMETLNDLFMKNNLHKLTYKIRNGDRQRLLMENFLQNKIL